MQSVPDLDISFASLFKILGNYRVDFVLWQTEHLFESNFLELVFFCNANIEERGDNVGLEPEEGDTSWVSQNWVQHSCSHYHDTHNLGHAKSTINHKITQIHKLDVNIYSQRSYK